jgi:PAS domain S-box-containing protein
VLSFSEEVALEFITHLFDTSDFPARWHCGEWSAGHGWLHILSDLGVWSAYFAIPGVFGYFLARRKDLPFRSIFVLFAAFILLCGSTHLMEAVIFWWPAYRLAGLLKLVTAIVSWCTVCALIRVAPNILAMRSPEDLEKEIVARKDAERRLVLANEELERRVKERTKELSAAVVELRSERKLLSTTLTSIGDGVIVTDAQGHVTFLNPVAETLTGWSTDNAQGQLLEAVFRVVGGENRAPVENPALRSLREGIVVGLTNYALLIDRQGRERPVHESAAPIRDESGKASGAVLVFRDMTEHRRHQLELEERERQFRTLADSIPLLCWMAEPDGRLFWYNRRWYDFTGTTLEEMEGWGWEKVQHPQELPRVVERWKQALASGEPWEDTFPLRRHDGEFREHLSRAFPVKDDAGRVVRWFGTNTDVADLKEAENRLRATEERFRLAAEAVNGLIYDFDVSAGTVWRSNGLKALVGFDPAEASTSPQWWLDLAHPDDIAHGNRKKADLYRGTATTFDAEYRVRHRDGHYVHVWERGQIVRTPQGKPIRVVGSTVDISERKAKEAAVAEANRRLEESIALLDTFLSTAPVGLTFLDTEFRFIRINPTLAALNGQTVEAHLGRPMAEVLPELWEPVAGFLRQVRETGESVAGVEVRGPIPGRGISDGTWEASYYPVRVGGTLLGYGIVVQDVTDRKRSEKETAGLVKRLTTLMDNTPLGVVEWDADFRVARWSGQAEKLFGWASTEVVGIPIESLPLIYEADRPKVEAAMARLRNPTNPFVVSRNRNTTKFGEVVSCEWYNSVLHDEAGGMVAILSLVLDVTERERAEEELRASEQRFQRFMDNSPMTAFLKDDQGRYVYVNRLLERQFDRPAAEWIGKTDAELFPESDPRRGFENDFAVLQAGRTIEAEETAERKTGTHHYLSFKFPVEGRDGQRLLGGMALDITGRKRAEQLAEEKRRILDGIMRHVPEGITIADGTDVKIRMVSRHGLELIDRPSEAIIGIPYTEHPERWGVCHPETGTLADPAELPLTRAVRKGEVVTNEEWAIRRPDGRMVPILCNAGPIRDANGSVAGGVIVWRDISEYKRLYDELRETDRRKDEFLATLAHELRNPLAPIRNAIHILNLKGSPDHDARRLRDMVERQVNHMVRLVDDLLDVSRISRGKIELQLGRVRLAEVVQNAMETSSPLIEAGKHRLSVTASGESLVVEGDMVRLTQVVANLLNNAAKYTPEGGHISIAVDREGSEGVIRVCDTGLGIPAEMMTRVFEMFTQVNRHLGRSQGGLGIGLTLVKRLVEMHGGSIAVHSEGEGKGAEFVVRLPLLETERQVPAVGRGEHNGEAAASCRILVVDDNVDAAESLAMLLSISGHQVRTANNGLAGLDQVSSFRPDVVLLDLGMPGIDGYETARKIRESQSDKQPFVVALTGWGQDEDRRRTKEAGFDFHMVKPVDTTALQDLLSTLLID